MITIKDVDEVPEGPTPKSGEPVSRKITIKIAGEEYIWLETPTYEEGPQDPELESSSSKTKSTISKGKQTKNIKYRLLSEAELLDSSGTVLAAYKHDRKMAGAETNSVGRLEWKDGAEKVVRSSGSSTVLDGLVVGFLGLMERYWVLKTARSGGVARAVGNVGVVAAATVCSVM